MKRFLLLALFLPFFAHAQSNLFIAFEPNYGLGNRKLDKRMNDNYLSSANAMGVGVRAGYEMELDKGFLLSANLQYVSLTQGIVFDFTHAGIPADVLYGEHNYNLGYYKAIGLAISGGYRLKSGYRHTFDIAAGLHTDVITSKTGNFIQIGSEPGATLLYQDMPDDRKIRFGWGIDGYFTWNFKISKQRFFAGLHYAMTPGQAITGTFESMPQYPSANSGTYKVSVAYLGLNLGIKLSKKEEDFY